MLKTTNTRLRLVTFSLIMAATPFVYEDGEIGTREACGAETGSDDCCLSVDSVCHSPGVPWSPPLLNDHVKVPSGEGCGGPE